MKVLRVVANVDTMNPSLAEKFYGDVLALELLMDMNWIRTYGSSAKMSVQVSFVGRAAGFSFVIHSGIS